MNDFILNLLLVSKETFIYGLSGFLIAILVTPLYFLKTQRQSTGKSYYEILNLIKINSKNQNNKFYFAKVIFSGVFYIAILNAYASMIFGLVEGFSIPLIPSFFKIDSYSISGILIRTLLIGFFESIINVYFDYKAISNEKIAFSGKETYLGTNLIIFSFLSFLKNTIGWTSTTFSIFIIYQLRAKFFIELSYLNSSLLSFFIALFFSSLLLPFDVICVKTVGAGKKKNLLEIIKELFKINGLSGIKKLCHGGVMRIVIMSIFAAGTVLVDLYLKK
jgi:hypothetical protein